MRWSFLVSMGSREKPVGFAALNQDPVNPAGKVCIYVSIGSVLSCDVPSRQPAHQLPLTNNGSDARDCTRYSARNSFDLWLLFQQQRLVSSRLPLQISEDNTYIWERGLLQVIIHLSLQCIPYLVGWIWCRFARWLPAYWDIQPSLLPDLTVMSISKTVRLRDFRNC